MEVTDLSWFSEQLIAWYHKNKRDLPWRHTKNIYHIWLSEVILQQTRVDQGMAYYHRFTTQFPTVIDLAKAPQDEVLKAWQGLGYYSRARNLHFTAQYIANELNGNFPTTFEGLKKLKGVGDYTAAALASICYQEKVAVVDGNVYRVLARIFGIATPIDSTLGKKEFQTLAQQLISEKEPDTFNQAIMEFGATHCTPKEPNCATCIFKSACVAFEQKTIKDLPYKAKKTQQRNRFFNYFYLENGTTTLLEKRGKNDIWEGLYDFLLIESETAIDFESALQSPKLLPLLQNGFTLKNGPVEFKHILSHQVLYAKFYHIHVNIDLQKQAIGAAEAIDIEKLNSYPVSRLTHKYLEQRTEEQQTKFNF